MRRIMVLNAKGGCGKTTLVTNLASHYATAGARVGLVDLDQQRSSLDWLAQRPATQPAVRAVDPEAGKAAWSGLDWLILDAPAGVHGKEVKRHVKQAQSVLIPVLPSPIDIRATARFIEELLLVGRISRDEVRIAVVANRVKEHTLIYQALQRFLASLGIPFVATLRDSQNYIRAAERGLGIFELPPSAVTLDVEQWQPLLAWLAGPHSLPPKK